MGDTREDALQRRIDTLPNNAATLFAKWRKAVEVYGRSTSLYCTSLRALEEFVADLHLAFKGADNTHKGKGADNTHKGPGY